MAIRTTAYEAREVHSHAPLSDVLAVHVIELPRLEQASGEGESVELQRWARFLRLDDERELESLAREAPIMAEAKRALEILSAEPDARRIAEMRREAEIARRLDRAEDLAEGRLDMLRRNIEQFCAAFCIELDDTRRAVLHSLDLTALDALFVQLMQQRAWPLEPTRTRR